MRENGTGGESHMNAVSFADGSLFTSRLSGGFSGSASGAPQVSEPSRDSYSINGAGSIACAGIYGKSMLRADTAGSCESSSPTVEKKVTGYHRYEEMTAEMREMADLFPELCQMTSIGKTYEGRDIWALRITKEQGAGEPQSGKAGILFTGLLHAREWITGQIVLHEARALLNGYGSDPEIKKRVDSAEIWCVPCSNPDGYEYSLTKDDFWRKNRAPLKDCSKSAVNIADDPDSLTGRLHRLTDGIRKRISPEPVGVDLNRNFWDGDLQHYYLYRPPGDLPDSHYDDIGGSDYPGDEIFRGREGGSESETRALMNLQLSHRNIKAAIDFHSYGEKILYPLGLSDKKADNEANYIDAATEMAGAISGISGGRSDYAVMKGSDMAITTGDVVDFQYIKGILGFTIEAGKEHQPSAEDIDSICRTLGAAQMSLIDYVMKSSGTLDR